MPTRATRVPTPDVEAGLRELAARGVIASWRTSRINGRRRFVIRWPGGTVERLEVAATWALIRGHRAARLGEETG